MNIRKNQTRRDFIKKAGIVNAGLALGLGLKSSDKYYESDLLLSNIAGIKIQLFKSLHGWGLGTISLNGKKIEADPMEGIMFLRSINNGEIRWLNGSKVEQLNTRIVLLSGSMLVDGVMFKGSMEVAVDEAQAVIRLTPSWSVNKDLQGWEVGLTYHKSFTNNWRVQSYPFAGNSEKVNITPMRYCGVPGALVYNHDLSMSVLFAIDSKFDYLNPTTWTGKTNFVFENGKTPPQFLIGGGKLKAEENYQMPLQLFLSDAGAFTTTISTIMPTWMKMNDYKVDTSLYVRSPQEAFDLAVNGRRNMKSWRKGCGYEHHRNTPFIYIANNPYIAYFEYLLYGMTGEKMWKDRAFEQIDFLLKGQQECGVFHTSWYFKKRGKAEGFCSWDWGHNGYKVDMNLWASRYILQTWQLVKEKEGIDRQDWYKAAIRSLSWIMAQQNQDGGLPQVVEISTGKKSQSVVSARSLVGFPIISEITGDERYHKLSLDLEKFLRKNVEDKFWYTGMHPDLPPEDYEQDSIYGVVEYWLNKSDRTGEKECLDHAVANAYYALLYWCPKQLSWVKNPTQCAHSEQQHFNQYSVYNYGNRKLQCLDRLYKKTNNPMFDSLKNHVMQLNFFTQVTVGLYSGAVTEAIADPWLERESGFEWQGNPYTSELVSDLMIQLIELGLVK
jgi:hypothetical protein